MKPKLPFKSTLVASLLFLGPVILAAADAPKYGLAADNHIFAQKLVNEIADSTPSLVAVGIHCVAPGAYRQSIVASTLNIIGKPSDPEDIVRGSTTIAPSRKAPKIGVMMPLHDRTGREIGSLALQFKFQAGEDQVKILAAATEIRERVARQIPSLADLFATQP